MSDDAAPADPLEVFRGTVRRFWPLAIGIAALLVLLLVLFRRDLNWGDVPTWLMAVTTALALAAAVFAGLVAYALLLVEDERDKKAHRDKAEVQARQVAAWYQHWQQPTASPASSAEPPAEMVTFYGALIRNSSNLPIYRVQVFICIPVPEGSSWRDGDVWSPVLTQVVPPGDTRVSIPDSIRWREEFDEHWITWRVALEFTDAAGRRWLRDPSGGFGLVVGESHAKG